MTINEKIDPQKVIAQAIIDVAICKLEIIVNHIDDKKQGEILHVQKETK